VRMLRKGCYWIPTFRVFASSISPLMAYCQWTQALGAVARLSYDGMDGSHMFLSMSEVLGLKLRSESVVLSACNTGSGQISRAEGS